MKKPAPRRPLEPTYLRDLFGRNAQTYDPVNQIISLGLVRIWRRQLVREVRIRPQERVLDAFCGPGSLGLLAARHLGSAGELVFADLSPVMLGLARANLRHQCRASACPAARFVQGDVLDRPAGKPFDVILLGFALRYTAQPGEALASLSRLLAPGGRLAVLEFLGEGERTVWTALNRWYFHQVLPAVAGRLGRGREVYDYLSASSAAFLTLRELEEAATAAGLRPRLSRARMGGLVGQLIVIRESG